MAILYFQAFVVFTILVARVVSRAALLPVCIAWTAFTFLAVFASPLLLLQLGTIWITYSALSGSPNAELEAKPTKAGRYIADRPLERSAGGRSVAQTADREASLATQPQAAPTKRGVTGVLNDLNGFVRSAQAVQNATSELTLAIAAERSIIDSAVDAARRKLEIELQFEGDPAKAEYYREAYAELLAHMDAYSPAASQVRKISWVKPDFAHPPAHAAAETTVKIEDAFEKLEHGRKTYLAGISSELQSNAKLRSGFMEQLRELVEPESAERLIIELGIGPAPIGAFAGRRAGVRELNVRDRMVTHGEDDICSGSLPEPEDQVAQRRSSIRRDVDIRAIPYLVHFTQTENLPSIMTFGIRSIAELQARKIRFFSNDALRLDHQPNATSLSIAFPNDKLFFKARRASPEKAWAVLVIDRAILWSTDVAFCAHNAASSRVSSQSIADRKNAKALSAMFEQNPNGPTREEQFLAPYDPSDVQAEILAFETIPASAIIGLAFSSSAQLARYRPMLGDRRVAVQKEGEGFFGARSQARRARWQF